MVKKISLALFSLAIIIVCVTLLVSFFTKSNDNVNAIPNDSEEVQYVLKDYNGNLAAFYSDESTPYQQFNLKTESFPEYDQQILKKGIEVETYEEMRQLIEDYTG